MIHVTQVYDAIRTELEAGGRVYIVCPLVSSTHSSSNGNNSGSSSDGTDPDSSSSSGGVGGAGCGNGGGSSSSGGSGSGRVEGELKRTVMDEYERLTKAGVFGAQHGVGLLHGRMGGEEKAQALKDFSWWAGG